MTTGGPSLAAQSRENVTCDRWKNIQGQLCTLLQRMCPADMDGTDVAGWGSSVETHSK